ncbi:CDP-alcohol phosphatidyltransferase family protein [Rhizobium halophilum]|uniref:CDP-alcohol phosphatidyltransferase family protein n=1 Tax=Rhizobium halophilum TaxID=2846852 RepID=UPI001EFDBE11|nr:CDP-alcohol phosphatidyltransferase family protein [Rhizobium halophilum]MCF6368018.1 CDP-alcohol phosphatidyltransferase family protein [Rhizobium halophilum]
MTDHAQFSGTKLILPKGAPHRTPLAVYAQAAGSFLLGIGLIVVAFRVLASQLNHTSSAMWLGLGIYLIISLLALMRLSTYPHRRFGAANLVTSVRGALTAMVGGMMFAFEGHQYWPDPHLDWTIIGIAAISFLLDGVDGYLARRSGTSSRFGARFDMEIDALMILFLAAGAALLGKAGAWVLLIGLLRYFFLAAQLTSTRLTGDLPESMRRKAICVTQGVALCVALAPVVPPIAASSILLLALLALLHSFFVDTAYLWNMSRDTSHAR